MPTHAPNSSRTRVRTTPAWLHSLEAMYLASSSVKLRPTTSYPKNSVPRNDCWMMVYMMILNECVLSDAMHLSLTRTGSSPVQGKCGHEQLMRVAPHVHMYGSASVCYILCRAGSPLVLLALRDGCQLYSQVVKVPRRSDGWRSRLSSPLTGRVEIKTFKSDAPFIADRFR